MKGVASKVEVLTARNLKEAFSLLAKGGLKPLAGATDLGVEFNRGFHPQGRFLNIWPLRKSLGKIDKNSEHLRIGALTSFTDLRENTWVQKSFPNLAQAAGLVGALQIQNRATIGGNIVNASPAADSLPALLSYGARLKIQSAKGERFVFLSDFYRDYKKMDLRPDELLVEVQLPWTSANTKHYYRKVGTRQAQAISKVVFSGSAEVKAAQVVSVRLAVGSVGPYTLRLGRVEKVLEGARLSGKREALIEKTRKVVLSEISPRDDIRSTRDYREFVTQNLVEEFISTL